MVTECEERWPGESIFRVARLKASMLFEAFYSADGHMGRLWFCTDMDRKKHIDFVFFFICCLTCTDSESVSSVFKHCLSNPS